MLTKEHIKYRVRGSKIFPGFVSLSDESVKDLLPALIDVFRTSVGKSEGHVREEIAERGFGDSRASGGLIALLMRRCKFAKDEPLTEQRIGYFLNASELRRSATFRNFEEFGEECAARWGEPLVNLREELYSDLPEKRKIESFADISYETLLDEFNLAQVQGLVTKSNELEISVTNLSNSAKRALFRGIRFNRLVADTVTSSGTALSLRISGPLAVTGAVLQYGTRLANFLNWIVACETWQLRAEVNLKDRGRTYSLELDETSKLKGRGVTNSGYIPSEYQSFIEALGKDGVYKVTVSDEVVHLGRDVHLFPDFCITEPGGRNVQLELYHRWHFGKIEETLQLLEKKPRDNLIIGICRSVNRSGGIGKLINESEWFKKNGFLFNDFPSPRSIRQLLRRP